MTQTEEPTFRFDENGQSKDSWRKVTFGDMAQCVTDRVDNPAEAGVDRYVGLEHLDPETLQIRRWGVPTDVESTKLRFQPGDIIFGKRRAYQRKLAVADFEGICSAHAMVLRAREETVLKEFLPVFMQSDLFFDRALSISVGSLSPTINWKELARQEFLMVFAAQKLRRHPKLKAPTVIIVVDRIDLDAQITATFNASDIPNVVAIDNRDELQRLLAADTRKLLITTIHKFGEADGVLNARDNIILMVDEAHRTQEGDLGQKMRQAIPNGFLFGLTGTPINKRDRNTFWAFGAEEDSGGYMSRYSFEESIRDGATLPLHFEARMVELRVDKETIDAAFAELTGRLTEEDSANLSKQAAKVGVLVKAPERVQAICEDIVQHFQEKVAPNGFKAQIVTYDQTSCCLYKAALDRILPPEASEVIISVKNGETDPLLTQYRRGRDDDERLQDRFRDPADPLQFLIVTARLLTGFDAPILQTMYLDKPLKEHTLLQAICRTNRPFPNKTHGLIVDYLGIFDEVAQALAFDEESMKRVITNLDVLKERLPELMAQSLGFFPNVDRAIPGYEGLMLAQECLPTNDKRDEFAAAFSMLNQLWEALSPDPCLAPYRTDYRWLGQVYESVKPPSGNGKLIWHALGAKTLE